MTDFKQYIRAFQTGFNIAADRMGAIMLIALVTFALLVVVNPIGFPYVERAWCDAIEGETTVYVCWDGVPVKLSVVFYMAIAAYGVVAGGVALILYLYVCSPWRATERFVQGLAAQKTLGLLDAKGEKDAPKDR